jgi:hypothetical protein
MKKSRGLDGFVIWFGRISEKLRPTYGFEYGSTAGHDQTNGCVCKKRSIHGGEYGFTAAARTKEMAVCAKRYGNLLDKTHGIAERQRVGVLLVSCVIERGGFLARNSLRALNLKEKWHCSCRK